MTGPYLKHGSDCGSLFGDTVALERLVGVRIREYEESQRILKEAQMPARPEKSSAEETSESEKGTA